MQKNLIPNSFNNSATYPYLTIYFSNANNMDLKYLGMDYNSLETFFDTIDEVQAIVSMTILTNAYKYNKIWEVNNADYNPIWNVDGTETETHSIGARTRTDNYGTSIATSTNSQVPDDMTTEKEVASNTSTRQSYSDSTQDAAATDTITKVRGGNIGVTMTQQLIEAERKIADYNLMDVIMKDIINGFCYPCFGRE